MAKAAKPDKVETPFCGSLSMPVLEPPASWGVTIRPVKPGDRDD